MNRLLALLFSLALGASLSAQEVAVTAAAPRPKIGPPTELSMTRAGSSHIDLRALPQVPIEKRERPEREEPEIEHTLLPGAPAPVTPAPFVPVPSAPAPPPIANFDGLDFASWGGGHPPDTNGDVGPNHYIETINTSIGVYNKSGTRLAAFSFNAFMSQGNFGNICDTNNFGDPVVVYDSFEDRWIITDFAFQIDAFGNILNPPGVRQCFAVSISGDPVAGGWNYYSILVAGGLADYPKFGVWTDGLYMTANMFPYNLGAAYTGARMWAFNKAQMYAGAPSVQVVTFDGPTNDFTLLPSNARLQTGTPPPGTPNYYTSTALFLNALAVYKFHVDWTRTSLSTFTGPDTPLASSSWPNQSVPQAPTPGNPLDTLPFRAMAQNQYSNISGAESLWTSHTVRRVNNGAAAPRWYQTNVTGGTVAANLPQAATWDPDGTDTFYRFAPSLAVDRAGNMALGYSKSNATTNPQIKYAGRLAGDPVNTFSQTEQTLINGTGTQSGICGSTCTRWGDYSAMTLDPDGCTFWYTNEYYAVNGLNYLTRIASFQFPGCTTLSNNGALQGTVTSSVDGSPIAGATLQLGSRSTTTNASGNYTLGPLPSGTYPVLTASFAGFGSSSVTSIAISDGSATTRNFVLSPAPASGCPIDTTTSDFQTGALNNVDATSTAGSVTLAKPSNLDQQNLSVTNTGLTFSNTNWQGQTFTTSTAGQLVRVDLELFCFSCSGTPPDITVSVRATAGGLPTGSDLATATVAGFSTGSAAYYSAMFASPATLASGTRYAVVFRAVSNPSPNTYAFLCSCTNSVAGTDPYLPGQIVTSGNSGVTWGADGVGRDAGFKTYIQNGFVSSGDFTSAVKDANPPAAFAANWGALTWTASVPEGTTLRFQAAASNSPTGPFNFVGPNGTAATFFTSGASLAQFNGKRYLEYKAFFTTTSNTVTPVLNDVQICFTTNCLLAPLLAVPQSVPVGATGVTASVTNHPGNTYAWTLTGGVITGGQGTSTITYNAGVPGSRMTLSVVESAGGGCVSPASQTAQMVDFLDVPPSNAFHNFIIKIALAGITGGCGGGNFCPNDSVTRAQMAVFLLIGKNGSAFVPPAATGIFNDVAVGSFAANFIEELFHEGITGGCSSNPPLYCPANPVTRAQMAVFLLTAEHGAGYVPPAATGLFGDVPPGAFARNFIEQLYNEGITGGCSSIPLLYCPANSTTRGQMSVFLSVTFALP